MSLFRLPCALTLLITTTGCCLAYAQSTTAANENGVIIERNAYKFASYEEAVKATAVENYADKLAYDHAVGDSNFEFQKLKYFSDGLKVTAYLYRPKRIDGQKLPTIIFNRGSAVRGDIAPEVISSFHRLASEGFLVLAPLLRQSDGGEGRDELGGADMDDLMNIIPLAKSLGFADMNNLFMYGESRGGMMTYIAIKRKFPVNAAAVVGAFTDLQLLVDAHPKEYSPAFFYRLWPEYETRKSELFEARSAIRWLDQLSVPLLIMHGGADWSVSPAHSLNLAQQLQKLGRVYELIVYAEDGHILQHNQVDRDRRATSWFGRFMK
jgi:dipeptidyl aminopeptidase/acylaminoacyl peptidase